jgi:anti-sigma factor RsiW
MMCEKELLVGYLYDELSASEQQEFERHLTGCDECRDEVKSLRATRSYLELWRPPEPDLGFEIVRRSAPAVNASRFSVSPIWGLAAAAVLVLAAAAAIANLELRFGSDGLVVRTGWNRGSASTSQTAAVPVTSQQSGDAATRAEVQVIVDRLTELESRLSAQRAGSGQLAVSGDASRASDAEILRRVRDIVAESEKRQQSVLASRVVQAMRELEAAYRTDLVRLQQGITQNQGLRDAEVYRQREMLNQVYRLVGQQR